MEKNRAKARRRTESGGIFLAEFEAVNAVFMILLPMSGQPPDNLFP
jgi:hypothetical protein